MLDNPGQPTPGAAYCDGILVRVIAPPTERFPGFCAGLIIDRKTQRVVITAPILRVWLGAHADKVRQGFKRLGWTATIVRRYGQEPVAQASR